VTDSSPRPESEGSAPDQSESSPSSLVSGVKTSLSLLTRRDRRLYAIVVVIQMSTGLLDLLGVLLIGLVAVLATSSVQSEPPPETVSRVLSWLGLSDVSQGTVVVALAILAAFVLLAKSVIFVLLSRRVFRFLGKRQGQVSSRLVEQLLSLPLAFVEKRSSQETIFAVFNAVTAAITATLGSLAVLLSELALLVLMSIAILLIDPIMALVAVAFFSLVGFGLQKTLSSWSARTGRTLAATAVQGAVHLQEAILSYRESTVLGRRGLFVRSIGDSWGRAGEALGDQLFIGQLPKVAYESALVVGAAALAAYQLATRNTTEAVATLALFLAAGSRVVPSMLRINGLLLAIRSGTSQARVLFDLVDDMNQRSSGIQPPASGTDVLHCLDNKHVGFTGKVSVIDISVAYDGNPTLALDSVSTTIQPGTRLAVVGPTGSGKSTFADCVMGIVTPGEGRVTVSGVDIPTAIATWPGAMAYVPQQVAIVSGSVRENVALGLPSEVVDDERVWYALEQAHIADFLRESRAGLDTEVGERGVTLSGGQRQRLGLARSLYTSPRLLVLDEATSALDSQTEFLVAQTISLLPHDVTVIMIAHRLATIVTADVVAYFDEGRLTAFGTLESVLSASAAFRDQMALLGYTTSGH